MTDPINSDTASITQTPEHKKKLDDLESLKTELAKLVSERDTLENTIKKNLEALYAIKIGKNEFTLFKTECEIARLKRKIELFQVKINHGEKFNILEVEGQLDEEYEKWDKEISKMLKDIENSKNRLSSLRTREDSIELQTTYRILVKRLHPDVNSSQTERSKLLWNRTMHAYSLGDLEELRSIKLLIDDSKGETNVDSGPNLDDRIGSIKKKVFILIEYIKKIKSEFPFTIEQDMDDENWVADKNSKIFKKIDTLDNKKEELQKIVDRLLLQSIDNPDPGTVN